MRGLAQGQYEIGRTAFDLDVEVLLSRITSVRGAASSAARSSRVATAITLTPLRPEEEKRNSGMSLLFWIMEMV